MRTGDQRKAAILFRSLDPETAASLLAQLDPAEAETLRQAVRNLDGCDGDERSDVVAEFRRAATTAAENSRNAVEIDPTLFAAADALEIRNPPPEVQSDSSSVSLLAGTDPRQLVPLLAREHAQTVALVLSRLAPSQAANVLAALPEQLQSDVIWRLSVMGESDPESLREVEQLLAERLAGQPAYPVDAADRTEHVAHILAAIDPHMRAAALTRLERRDQQLASQLAARLDDWSAAVLPEVEDASPTVVPAPAELPREPVVSEPEGTVEEAADQVEQQDEWLEVAEVNEWVIDPPVPSAALQFEQLAGIDAATLAAVLSEVQPHVVTLALAGADDALVGRVTERLSWRDARRLRRRLRLMGPLRLSDVAQAQDAVAEAATQHLVRRHGQRSGLSRATSRR